MNACNDWLIPICVLFDKPTKYWFLHTFYPVLRALFYHFHSLLRKQHFAKRLDKKGGWYLHTNDTITYMQIIIIIINLFLICFFLSSTAYSTHVGEVYDGECEFVTILNLVIIKLIKNYKIIILPFSLSTHPYLSPVASKSSFLSLVSALIFTPSAPSNATNF